MVEQARETLIERPGARAVAWVVAASASLIVAFRLLLSAPVPAGVLLFGLVIGSINALLAVGLILVYRANRIVNFAQAEIGVFGAILFENLVRDWQLPWLAALALGIGAAGALGGLVEVLIMRRFRSSPRLITTVATIGVAQLVVVATLFLADLFGEVAVSGGFHTPLSGWGLTVTGVRLSGDALLLLASVPVVVVALQAVLQRTEFGVAVRAAAESGERAELLGIPVRRVTTALWVLAGLLAGMASSLRSPVIGLISGASVQGPEILLRALAAAVLARMNDLRVAVGAGLALGVVEYAVTFAENGSTVINVVLVVVILVGSTLQGGARLRVSEGATSTWSFVELVRSVPRELRALPEVRWGTLGALAAVGAGVVGFGLVASPSHAYLGAAVAIYGIVAISLVVLTGWAGQISLGQFGIAGFGAGLGARLYADAGWDFLLAALAGGVGGAAVSILLGTVALRVRGFYFAVSSLGFAVAVQSFFLNPNFFTGLLPDHRPERPFLLERWDLEDERAFFFFAVTVLAMTSAAVTALRRSRTGRVLIAVRDNERAAAGFGVSAVGAKLLAFATSGFLAGLAGVLLAVHQHAVSASAYSAGESLRAFTMAVIGGLGSLPGALLGAIFVRGASFFLSDRLALLASGAGLLGVLLVLPAGLSAPLYRARDACLRWVAMRRGLRAPSLVRSANRESSDPTEPAAPITDQGAVAASGVTP